MDVGLRAEESAERLTKKKMRWRYYLALDFLSIYGFVLVVYGGGALTEYLLFSFISLLLQEEIARYQLVAAWFENAKIGLALLTLALGVIHAVVSTVRLIWMCITGEGE